MRSELEQLHKYLGNCRAVAMFLGYSLRGYMDIRRKVRNGEPLGKRTEALILQRLSKVERQHSKSNEGVAPVTNHISSKNSNNGGAGYQKEFNKARRKIQSLLQAGKSRKDVHERLSEAGRLSMSYASFCGFVVKEIEQDPLFLTPPSAQSDSRRQGDSPAKRTPRR